MVGANEGQEGDERALEHTSRNDEGSYVKPALTVECPCIFDIWEIRWYRVMNVLVL